MFHAHRQSNLGSTPSLMDQPDLSDPLIQVAMVFAIARVIEPDLKRVTDWYLHDPIASLEGFTAEQMVKAARTCELIDFLGSIDF